MFAENGHFGGTIVKNSTFTNNNAQNGGAIGSINVHALQVSGCHFENNTATNFGGAISGVGLAYLTLTSFNPTTRVTSYTNVPGMDIQSSTFQSNYARQGGGSIGIASSEINSRITSCNFFNSSSVEGGTLYGLARIAQMSNCILANSTAQDGGCLYYIYGALTSTSNTYRNCFAKNDGGAIMFGLRMYLVQLIFSKVQELLPQLIPFKTLLLLAKAVPCCAKSEQLAYFLEPLFPVLRQHKVVQFQSLPVQFYE